MGSFVGDVESLQPVAKGQGWTQIDATEAPSTIQAVCSAGVRPPAGAGYDISTPEVVEGELGDVQIAATIEWKTEDAPGTASCTATLTTSEGTEIYDFTLSAPQGRHTMALLPDRMKGALVEGVSCTPFS